jgi:AcrR family transcriptional regulator
VTSPSLYKHFPDKTAVETAVTVEALAEADVLEGAGADLEALASAYRAWATANPHLHRFLNPRLLPRERLPPGLEQRAAAPCSHTNTSSHARLVEAGTVWWRPMRSRLSGERWHPSTCRGAGSARVRQNREAF